MTFEPSNPVRRAGGRRRQRKPYRFIFSALPPDRARSPVGCCTVSSEPLVQTGTTLHEHGLSRSVIGCLSLQCPGFGIAESKLVRAEANLIERSAWARRP